MWGRRGVSGVWNGSLNFLVKSPFVGAFFAFFRNYLDTKCLTCFLYGNSLPFSPHGKFSLVLAVYNISKGWAVFPALPSVNFYLFIKPKLWLFLIESYPLTVLYPHLEFMLFFLFKSESLNGPEQVCDSRELNCCTKSADLQMIPRDNWNKKGASRVTVGSFSSWT